MIYKGGMGTGTCMGMGIGMDMDLSKGLLKPYSLHYSPPQIMPY